MLFNPLSVRCDPALARWYRCVAENIYLFSLARSRGQSRPLVFLSGRSSPELLCASFDLDRRRSARVLKLQLTKPFLELRRLAPQLFALISNRNGLEMLARAYDKAARQQGSGDAYRREPPITRELTGRATGTLMNLFSGKNLSVIRSAS